MENPHPAPDRVDDHRGVSLGGRSPSNSESSSNPVPKVADDGQCNTHQGRKIVYVYAEYLRNERIGRRTQNYSSPPGSQSVYLKKMFKNNMIQRREFLAGGIVLLAGCSQLNSSGSPTDTTATHTDSQPTEDHSLPDLWIGNTRGQSVVVSVELQPDGEPEPTLSMTVRVPSEEKILWDDSKIFDDPGQVRASLPNEDIEPAEASWNGDNEIDNRSISIDIQPDEINVLTIVA